MRELTTRHVRENVDIMELADIESFVYDFEKGRL